MSFDITPMLLMEVNWGWATIRFRSPLDPCRMDAKPAVPPSAAVLFKYATWETGYAQRATSQPSHRHTNQRRKHAAYH